MNRKIIAMMVAALISLGGLCFPAPAAYAASIDSGSISAAQKTNSEESEEAAATLAGTNPQEPEQELQDSETAAETDADAASQIPGDGQGGPSESTASASAVNLPDEDCVCESLCAEDSVNKDCLICGPDFTLCGFEAEPSTATDGVTGSDNEPATATDGVSLGESGVFAAEVFATETQATAQEDGLAYTFEALQALLDENGTVSLGASVTIPPEETLVLDGASILTGEYGITVEGYLDLRAGAVITGEGVSQPVIEVAAGGGLYADCYGFEQAPRIIAEGDGGCGLLLRAGFGEYHISPTAFLRVAANGSDAIAIQSEESFHLLRHFIEVRDGTGVVCPGEVSLFLCLITAGTAAVDAPGYIADTCVLSPAGGANGTVISRKISQDAYIRVPVKRGDPVPDAESGWREFGVTLRTEGHQDDGTVLGATVEIPEIDTNVIGVYPLTVTLDECWEAFDLLPEDEILIAAEVYNPDLPYYLDAYVFQGTDYVDYYFEEGDMSVFTLWRSDDEGESWYDYTDDAELERYGYMISVPFFERPEHPVLLVWEAEGIGETEILRISWDSGSISGVKGGDRGGRGRGETTPPVTASTPEPPPDDEDGSGDGNNTPDDSGDDDGSGDGNNTPADPGDEDDSGDGNNTPADSGNEDDSGDGNNTPVDSGSEYDSGDDDSSDDSGRGRPADRPTRLPVPVTPPASAQLPTIPTGDGSTAMPQPAAATGNLPADESEELSVPESAAMPDEAMDKRGVTVSGGRLAVMIEAYADSVPFWSGRLRVSLPAVWLRSLALAETDSFAVALWQPEENSFTVSFAVNGMAVTDRLEEAFLLSLPWSDGPVSCASADGDLTEATLTDGRAEFALFEAGTYTLTETEDAAITAGATAMPARPAAFSAQEPQQEPNPYSQTSAFIICGACVACAVTAFAFLRKRLVKR